MKILEEFWYGNISPLDRSMDPNSRMGKLSQLVAKNEEKLIPFLSEEAKVYFERYKLNQAELSSVSECEVFVLGYKLEARMTYEVIGEWRSPTSMTGSPKNDLQESKKRNWRKFRDQAPDTHNPLEKMMLF